MINNVPIDPLEENLSKMTDNIASEAEKNASLLSDTTAQEEDNLQDDETAIVPPALVSLPKGGWDKLIGCG